MEEPSSTTKHNKAPLLIVGAVLLVLVLAGVTIFVLKLTRPASETSQIQTASDAKATYDEAQKSLIKGDLTAAKMSFEKARELYKHTNDTTYLKEIEAALSLIDHSKDKPTKPTEQAPTASTSISP